MRVMLMAAVLASGCSIVVTKGPGGWTPESKRAPVCDTSNTLPRAVDIVLTVASALTVGNVLADDELVDATKGALAGGFVLVTVGAITSIVVGRGRVRECRAAHEDWKRTVPATGGE
jgi:hypothetical protein